jgi:hypothetical protein
MSTLYHPNHHNNPNNHKTHITKLLAQMIHALLKGGLGLGDGGEGRVDESEFGLLGGGDDEAAGGAVSDEGAHEDGVVAVCDGGSVAWWWGGEGFCVFGYRVVFPCEGRFIDF